MVKGDGFISVLDRCLNAMEGNTASSDASDMLAAVMKAMGHGTGETTPVDSMAVHIGCYIHDRWGFGPGYRFDRYISGLYSVGLAEDLDLIGDTVPGHTDIPDEAVTRLSEIFGKGSGYVEAYGTVLLVADNSPGASYENILRRALELRPHLEDEVRDACDHVLPDSGASAVPDPRPCGDAGISDVTLVDADDILDNYFSFRQTKFPGKRILLKHIMNGGHRGCSFCAENESSGTVRMMYLSAHLVWVMRNGGTLMVDELERSLHPMLVDYLIGIVQDPEVNLLGAQLVFTTHDTGIVRRNGLGRDQIWIASRNPSVGVTVVYPFTDFDDDSDFETLYMDSRIGGVPRIREVTQCKTQSESAQSEKWPHRA